MRGLDHIVVAVKDLEAAGKAWQALGFTVTPTNHHGWGTANKLVQLDGFFVELLTVEHPEKIVEPTETGFSFGAFNREFLGKRQGISMVVADSKGAEEDRADFARHGLQLYDPFGFERVANLPDGSTAHVAFDLTFASDAAAPDLGYFACHNKFPENFWKPAFQTHANGAKAIAALFLVAKTPSEHRSFLTGFFGSDQWVEEGEGLRLRTARGEVQVMTPQAYSSLTGDGNQVGDGSPLPTFSGIAVTCPGLLARQVVVASDLYGMSLILRPE